MSKIRILSFDGGGIRGIISARILQRLCRIAGLSGWIDKADVIAGTSTGGIIALGLAYGKTPDELFTIYRDKGPMIFDDTLLDDIMDMGSTTGAEYSNKNLKAVLDSTFGDSTLGMLNRKIAIPAFNLDNNSGWRRSWCTRVFHNFDCGCNDTDLRIADAALYTSSAPVYFPTAGGFIDGGVYANNPSMIAVSQAMSSQLDEKERVNADNIVLLSIGTGTNYKYITGDSLNWGYLQWVKPMLNIIMDGICGITEYQCRMILGNRYCRIQPVYKGKDMPGLDEVSRIESMIRIAELHDLTDAADWLRNYWV